MGLVVQPDDVPDTLEMIDLAEQAGVDTVWLTAGRLRPDALTIMAAASQRARQVKMGAAIVPTWPQHPLSVARQVSALESLAPRRIRLGLGPSTAAAMSPYGAGFHRPLGHLREYVTCLRTLFREGKVDFRGELIRARGSIPEPLPTPVLASALGPGAFRLCGEIADGAITWVSPSRYVKEVGLRALREGAATGNRPPPPVVLCVPTLVSEDPRAVYRAAQKHVGLYRRFDYYREMFSAAGYPSGDDALPPALVDELVVSGSVEQVGARLLELASWSEVMVFPLTGGLTDRPGFQRCLEAIRQASTT